MRELRLGRPLWFGAPALQAGPGWGRLGMSAKLGLSARVGGKCRLAGPAARAGVFRWQTGSRGRWQAAAHPKELVVVQHAVGKDVS